MRFHLLGLPNAPVHPDYSLDGFAVATHRFSRMMMSLGHTVILYGAEGSDTSVCTEFVQVISERERRALLELAPANNCEYQHVVMDESRSLWQRTNPAMAAEVALRKQPKDFLLTIGGASQKPVFEFNPDLMPCEYSIGYTGNFCRNRVFESYAWMHHCLGLQQVTEARFFDTVIPLFFDPDEFPFEEKPDDYFLFVGRFIERKGVGIACQAATAAGVKLKFVGHGGDRKFITGGHEIVGAVDWRKRNELISKARALIVPTTYLEPFNAAAVEAQMCGTPVISTDFGGFCETVEQGKSGYRCSYLGEFVRAIKDVADLDRRYIRDRAHRLYSMWNLRHDYQRYFDRLSLLWSKEGWNTVEETNGLSVATNRITSGECSSRLSETPVHKGS
jgi:glycosyltransferase involved in cell wall biosynthesis